MNHRGTRVLVVDDEDGIRDLFRDAIRDMGYECLAAPNGDEALRALERTPADLMVVDIIMPGMSGLALFDKVMESWPDMAVVFVTALDDVDLAVRNMKGGAYDYLVKPVAAKRLQETVDEVLERRRTLMEERLRLDENEAQRSQELGQKAKEVAALNRLFQAHLSERFAVVEAYRDLLQRLRELAEGLNELTDMVQPGSPPGDTQDEGRERQA